MLPGRRGRAAFVRSRPIRTLDASGHANRVTVALELILRAQDRSRSIHPWNAMNHRSRSHHAAHLDDGPQDEVPQIALVHRSQAALVTCRARRGRCACVAAGVEEGSGWRFAEVVPRGEQQPCDGVGGRNASGGGGGVTGWVGNAFGAVAGVLTRQCNLAPRKSSTGGRSVRPIRRHTKK